MITTLNSNYIITIAVLTGVDILYVIELDVPSASVAVAVVIV